METEEILEAYKQEKRMAKLEIQVKLLLKVTTLNHERIEFLEKAIKILKDLVDKK